MKRDDEQRDLPPNNRICFDGMFAGWLPVSQMAIIPEFFSPCPGKRIENVWRDFGAVRFLNCLQKCAFVAAKLSVKRRAEFSGRNAKASSTRRAFDKIKFSMSPSRRRAGAIVDCRG